MSESLVITQDNDVYTPCALLRTPKLLIKMGWQKIQLLSHAGNLPSANIEADNRRTACRSCPFYNKWCIPRTEVIEESSDVRTSTKLGSALDTAGIHISHSTNDSHIPATPTHHLVSPDTFQSMLEHPSRNSQLISVGYRKAEGTLIETGQSPFRIRFMFGLAKFASRFLG